MTLESGQIYRFLEWEDEWQSEYLLLVRREYEDYDDCPTWRFHGMDNNKWGWEYEDSLMDPDVYVRLA